jgi:hypothetical protein
MACLPLRLMYAADLPFQRCRLTVGCSWYESADLRLGGPAGPDRRTASVGLPERCRCTASWAPRPRVDHALAQAFRWQRMADEGVCGTIEELAKREKINRGYMSRVLRLTLLAPDIVESTLDGRQRWGCGWGSSGPVSQVIVGPAGTAA